MGKGSVLIFEQDKIVRDVVSSTLARAGLEVHPAAELDAALQAFESGKLDAVILGAASAGDGASELIHAASRVSLEVIVLSSSPTIEEAVAFVKAGASDYLAHPARSPELLGRIERILERRRAREDLRSTRQENLKRHGVASLIGSSPAMQRVLNLVDCITDNHDATVLILGESGTGKDLIAKMIHWSGPRAEGPYMNVTCTTLRDTLLESELFGHERGAFTDAKTQKKGLVELADGGTLFLDEIGDMSLAIQSRLLRFLEERAFRRVGGQADLRVNVRVIAATNRNLEEMVARGEFREDLYFRLNVIPIVMPPLRSRKGDVPLLVRHFMNVFHRELHKPVLEIEPALMGQLEAYNWPGNVRELRNLVERAMVLSTTEVLWSVVRRRSRPEAPSEASFRLPPGGVDFDVLEKDLLSQALEAARGHQARAGELLGLNRDQVRYRMLKYGLNSPAPARGGLALRV